MHCRPGLNCARFCFAHPVIKLFEYYLVSKNWEKENNWNFHFPLGAKSPDDLRSMCSPFGLLAGVERQVLASGECRMSESWVHTGTPQVWFFRLQIPRLCPKVSCHLVWDGPPAVAQVPLLLLLRHLHWRTMGSHCAVCVQVLAPLLHCPLQVPLPPITKLPVLLFGGPSPIPSLKAKIKTNKWQRTNFYILVQAKNTCQRTPYVCMKTFESVTQSRVTIMGKMIKSEYWNFEFEASRLGFTSWSGI